MRWRHKELASGLTNLGNTCFLNSVLQCLLHTAPLHNYLLTKEHSKTCRMHKFCLFCKLEFYAALVFKKGRKVVAPKGVVVNLRSISKRFRPGRQEDSHEFIRFVLDTMQKNIVSGYKKVEQRVAETSVVHRIFGGYLRSQVKCLNCKHESNTYDPFLDLSLEVVQADSVSEALSDFTTAEVLDQDNKYLCAKCKRKVRARKQLTVFQAPNVLAIHLKRFQFSMMGIGGKINKPIRFAESLNLRKYMSDKTSDIAYSLYAVLVHQGGSTNSGHYFCFVKNGAGAWLCCNDESVSPLSLQGVMRQQAYILFYSKQILDPPASPRPPPQSFRGTRSPKNMPKTSPAQLSSLSLSPPSQLSSSPRTYAQPKLLRPRGPERPPHLRKRSTDDQTSQRLPTDNEASHDQTSQRLPVRSPTEAQRLDRSRDEVLDSGKQNSPVAPRTSDGHRAAGIRRDPTSNSPRVVSKVDTARTDKRCSDHDASQQHSQHSPTTHSNHVPITHSNEVGGKTQTQCFRAPASHRSNRGKRRRPHKPQHTPLRKKRKRKGLPGSGPNKFLEKLQWFGMCV